MKAVALSAFPRTLARRPGAKRLRAQGRVPAVIYGRQAKPQNLEVDRKDLDNLIHHSVTENFVRPAHRSLVLAEKEPDRLLDMLAKARPPVLEKWIEREEV